MIYLFYNWKFVTFDSPHPFCPLPNPTSGNHQSVLFIYELDIQGPAEVTSLRVVGRVHECITQDE